MKKALPWLVSGLLPAAALIVSVPAAAVTYVTAEEARKESFPNADRFDESHLLFTAEQRKILEEKTGMKVASKGLQVWKAYEKETFHGFFIIDYVIGKHEFIDYAVALDAQGKVTRLEVLTYRESYGSEVSHKGWQKQFLGKTWASPMKFNYDIMNIGGATLSCRHVTEGVRKILAVYDAFLRTE